MDAYFGEFQIVKFVFQRTLAGLYLIAFLVALNQFPALLGERGLLPVPNFIRAAPFEKFPSIFFLYYSDRFFKGITCAGIVLSLVMLFGFPEKGPWWSASVIWLVLWVFYLSIVNVGQTFYGFGWESMLLEAGFFSAFLGTSRVASSLIPILILRWMLFRTELGSGLIKIRGDLCWRDLTCLFYHHETQPMPNPLSWYFHHFSKSVLSSGVVFSHFVQIIVPFGLFAPMRIAAISGCLIIVHQLLLIISGNYSWLNWITVILGIAAFSDSLFRNFLFIKPSFSQSSIVYQWVLYFLAFFTMLLSIQPTLNFFSKNQLMNYSYNPLHLVASYGAFGSINQERYELIIEGTEETVINPTTKWKEYHFKGKPGDVKKMPPQIAPYHLRLDWLMWFLPFSVQVTKDGITTKGYEVWFLRFIQKLLKADKNILKLLRDDPFSGQSPQYIRVKFYQYHFTDRAEKKKTGNWWTRTYIDEYLPPVRLSDLKRLKI